MINIPIPGFRDLHLKFVVIDFNGTLAVDGQLLPGVVERLGELAAAVELHVVTADTYGTATQALDGLPVRLTIISSEDQPKAKRMHVLRLGAEWTAAIGNGRNDERMMTTASLGIAVMQREGTAASTLAAASVVTNDILHALDLLLHPERLKATLRS